MESFIKLHRKFLDWEWYSDHNTSRLFLYMLLSANWQDKHWQGNLIKRGQLVKSYSGIASATGLTIAQVRTSLKRLISTHEITHEPHNKFSVFTVVNYDKYQSRDTQDNNQIADEEQSNDIQIADEQHADNNQTTCKEQSNDNQIATTKELKELKELKKKEYCAFFEKIWKRYPEKKGKGKVSDTQKAKLLKIGYEELSRAIDRYLAYLEKNPQRETQYGSTFFNSGYVDYLDCNYCDTETKEPVPEPEPEKEPEPEELPAGVEILPDGSISYSGVPINWG